MFFFIYIFGGNENRPKINQCYIHRVTERQNFKDPGILNEYRSDFFHLQSKQFLELTLSMVKPKQTRTATT
uniref:Uncharacterized protein n=1 Tax=Octopus bimaculoides TaxID=37653 RepID=A0A0L8GX57_OCTBM